MEIPRNIRQIGDIENSLQLYMEDYVSIFIEKMKRKNDTCVGILLGKQEKEGDASCLFIRGAVLLKDYEIFDGRIVMTASSWSTIYKEAESCFQDVEICGWFLCSSDNSLTDLYNLQKSHNENFKSPNQVFILYNGDMDEEAIYRCDDRGFHKLRGHYIYYERNDQMQEYMVSREPARKTEFALSPVVRGASDGTTRQFRAIMEAKQEKNGQAAGKKEKEEGGQAPENHKAAKKAEGKQKEQGLFRFLRTVRVTALLCGVCFGLAAWYKYDGMQGFKDAVAAITGGEHVTEETESGQAVIEEIPGNVYPSKESAEAEETTKAGETQTETAESKETEAPSETEAPPETKAETEAETEATTEAAAEVIYEEYTVKRGDTLYNICKEIYGDVVFYNKVEEVCRLNEVDDADFIYEGQVLKLPE